MSRKGVLAEFLNMIFPRKDSAGDVFEDDFYQNVRRSISEKVNNFATIQPKQTSQGGQYASQKIAPKPVNDDFGEPYATFSKMREVSFLSDKNWGFRYDVADTFCKQAEFMKDFTDDCGRKVHFDSYYATYDRMNDEQLRTYFTWRTKVRQGVVEDNSIAYAFCYVNELLNGVGIANPEEGMEALITFWTAIREYHPQMDACLRDWIRDYYVVHKPHLKADFLEYACRFPNPYYDCDLELLVKATSCSWDDLKAIELSSSFRITNGKFYKSGNQAMIEQCVCHVLKKLAVEFKNKDVDFRQFFYQSDKIEIPHFFKGAVHKEVKIKPEAIRVSQLETIKHNGRVWYREYPILSKYRSVVGYILKCIEVRMREHFQFKTKLQMPKIKQVENNFIISETGKFAYFDFVSLEMLKKWKVKTYHWMKSEEFMDTIAKAITEYCKGANIVVQNGEIREVKPVEIDLSKLKDIEREHVETAKKLIMEEGREVELMAKETASPPIRVKAKPESAGIAGMLHCLTSEERKLLQVLLSGGQAPINCELLIETINERALGAISDNLIDYCEGVPYVYEEYLDELKSSFD